MIRLDRFLTEQNIGSRSEVKELCKKGLITVNGSICRQSDYKINSEQDRICVRGEAVQSFRNCCYMLNKPSGFVSAVSDAKEPTVISLFPDRLQKHLFPVGRLDKDSEGLLLITDLGQLCHDLTSPARHIEKTYEVWITGILTETELENLERGTDIGDDTLCLPAIVVIKEAAKSYSLSEEQKRKLPKGTADVITASRVHITVTEGRYHQIKRMFHANRHEVFSLKRISIGKLRLDPDLLPGEYRLLKNEEIELLTKSQSSRDAEEKQ